MGSVVDMDVMRFAREDQVPVWMAVVYLTSNIILNTLNFYWFGKMIETIRKRFQGHVTTENHDLVDLKTPQKAAKDDEVVVVEGVEVTMMANGEVVQQTVELDTVMEAGEKVVEVEKTEVRKRRGQV